jgi:hypothetical protein
MKARLAPERRKDAAEGGIYARLKCWLSRRRALREFCHDCGFSVRQVWFVPDCIWGGFSPNSGPRCIACFDKRALSSGVLLMWTARVESVSASYRRNAEGPTYDSPNGVAPSRGDSGRSAHGVDIGPSVRAALSEDDKGAK